MLNRKNLMIKKRRVLNILICVSAAILLPACNKQAGSSSSAGRGPEKAQYGPIEQLDVESFWDDVDFGDTLLLRDPDFLEQSFVNFIALGRGADREKFAAGVKKLVAGTERDSVAFGMLTEMTARYLFDPNSPMYSEEDYLLFLDPLIDSPLTKTPRREKLEWAKMTVMKNLPGTKAADIRFLTLDGKAHTLYGIEESGKQILLVFFDPDCEHCQEIMPGIESDPYIRRKVEAGELTVVAIYSGPLKELWEAKAKEMPAEWTVGIDDGSLEETDSYILRALPSLYLLDADKNVIFKDVSRETLDAFLANPSLMNIE